MTDSEFTVMQFKLMSIGATAAIAEAILQINEYDHAAAVSLDRHRAQIHDRAMAMCAAAFAVEQAREGA